MPIHLNFSDLSSPCFEVLHQSTSKFLSHPSVRYYHHKPTEPQHGPSLPFVSPSSSKINRKIILQSVHFFLVYENFSQKLYALHLFILLIISINVSIQLSTCNMPMNQIK